MKAVVMTGMGSADVLEYQDLPEPEPVTGSVRVRLKAAALNHRDIWIRSGGLFPSPLILGSDGAGVVDAVGRGVDPRWLGKPVVINASLYWGDREDAPSDAFQILGGPAPGTYAEAVVVPAENIEEKPQHLDFPQAAALPVVALTAWRALFTQGGLRPGETVLLPGIGSGVASMALLLAKRAGARVIVTSSSDEKLSTAQGLGADYTVNYSDPSWESEVKAYTRGEGVDLILDHTGEKTLPIELNLLRAGGRLVFFGATTGVRVTFELRPAYFRQLRIIGTTMGTPREFRQVMEFIEQQRIVPDICRQYPLREAAEAQRFLETARQYGKVALIPSDSD